jgi:hypothetical protein
MQELLLTVPPQFGRLRNMTEKMVPAERPVVICTAKRGVFFGYTRETGPTIIERGTVNLVRARMATYWSAETKGVLGLGSIGPQSGSKIGPEVSEFACESVTAVIGCTPSAAEQWEKGLWS